jgi:dephospho-CoA kinase
MICGKMCTGKSTLINYLKSTYGYSEFNFADKLKSVLKSNGCETNSYVNKLPHDQWFVLNQIVREALKIESQSPKYRERLQYIGDAVRNRISEYMWVNLLLDNPQFKESNLSIIGDCRYVNEYNSVNNIDWWKIKLTCNEDVRLKRVKELYYTLNGEIDDSVLNHPSETELDSIIFNKNNIFDTTDPNQFMSEFTERFENFTHERSKLSVYLGGCIGSGNIKDNYVWREKLTERLESTGLIKAVNPLHGVKKFDTIEELAKYEESLGYNIFEDDIRKINECDLLLIYEPYSISRGSNIEIGLAFGKKPIMYVSPIDKNFNHSFIKTTVNYRVHSLDLAVKILTSSTETGTTMAENIKNTSIAMRKERGELKLF